MICMEIAGRHKKCALEGIEPTVRTGKKVGKYGECKIPIMPESDI